MNNPSADPFLRSKIYEQLEYKPQPANYKKAIPWIVQQQVAATNGVHYVDRVGKLNEYPQFNLPVPPGNGIFLDIGCGWGRWLSAGFDKGYIPVGIDLRLEFCKTAGKTLANQGKHGYTVVADLQDLPFQDQVFDLVWSFSVIQHTHHRRLLSCLTHIKRILKEGGFTKLEFPNKKGIHNAFGPVKDSEKTKDDFNSWCVRYYSIEEYRDIFLNIFGDFKYENHSFLGIGVLSEDLSYVSPFNKLKCAVSLMLSNLTSLIPPLTRYSDSLYISAYKNSNSLHPVAESHGITAFMEADRKTPDNNLNITSLLRCPHTSGKLSLSDSGDFLLNDNATYKYPVIDAIPILVKSEAISLK